MTRRAGTATSDLDLVLQAEVDPWLARSSALAAVDQAVVRGDRLAEAIARRGLGVAERLLGRPQRGLEELDRALSIATDDSRLTGLIRISRAACAMSVGDLEGALGDLELASAVLDGADRAVAEYQRASILIRVVRDTTEPAATLDDAIRTLSRTGPLIYEAHARTNRGLYRTYQGTLGPARRDLDRARAIYLACGARSVAAVALHNLAFLSTREGDLIAALAEFDGARHEFAALGLDTGVLDLDCCDALLAAGLTAEAWERSVGAAEALAREGHEFEVPEAQLVAAVAAERCGDPDEAQRWASEAETRFRALGREGWGDLAELVRLRTAEPRPATRRRVRALAGRLERGGLLLGAMQARLLAARLALGLGRLDDAAGELGHLRGRRLPPDLRLGVCEAEARLADARGDGAATDRWVRRGVRELDRYQRSFASAEVRWAVTAHAKGVLDVGRHRAMASGRPGRVFRAVELARANALRRAPLTPPEDDRILALLGELRATSEALRAGPDPHDAARLVDRQVRIQRQIAERERAGRSTATNEGGDEIPSLAEVRAALAGRRLVQLDVLDDRVVAVVAGGARTVLRDVGPVAGLAARYDAATRALSRLARADLGARSHAAAVARLRDVAVALDEVLRPCWPGDGELVIAPPPELHAVPWALLPSLADRPFAVAASASIWLRAESAARPSRRRALLVAGTDLDQARAEVRAIARRYDRPTTLSPAKATAARVSAAAGAASIAHFATHHRHHRENPLFGSMDLADGPLYLHDLLRVPRLPHTVVLSSCQAAQGDVGAVGDVLGASTVLMERGTTSVIANASLVADSVTSTATMLELHTHLAGGAGSAAALLAARRAAAELGPRSGALAAGFTCFGAG